MNPFIAIHGPAPCVMPAIAEDIRAKTAMKKGRRRATVHLLLPWADEVSHS